MPGTAVLHSPAKYPSGSMSYEAAMGVPPEDMAPMFHFRKRFGEINWRKIGVIDIDKVARELDFVTLQENISMIAFCNIDSVSDLDPMFTKMFKLSQFTIEYLLHSQEYLQSVINDLEVRIQQGDAAQMAAHENIQELENQVQKLKAENKRRRKMIEQQQMLIESGASSYYKCPHCEKAFMNASFLQGHMQRKHPDSVHYIGDVIAHSQREQSRLADKLHNLDQDLQKERLNFTEKLKKAEEDKAAWAARTRRDMSRWKKEEEGKWRRELESMKQSFVDEIQKLKQQEEEYKKKIMSLQQTMDERHSNLGDLQDDFEGEKQRLLVYEDRIKTLERTNAEKDSQLKHLSSEMANLREQNKQALLQHKRSMTDSFDGKLQQMKEKVEKPVISREQSEETPESIEEVDTAGDGISEMRRNRASIAAQMRPILIQMMEANLQKCGVDPAAPGISTQTLMNKLQVMKTERQRKARNIPELFAIRDQMRRKVEEEVNARNQGSPPRKKRGRAQTLPRQRQQSPAPAGSSRSMGQFSAPLQSRVTGFTPSESRVSAPAGRIGLQGPSPERKTDKTMTRDELNTQYQDEEEESLWDSEMSEVDSPPTRLKPGEKQTSTPIQQHSTPKPTISTRAPTTPTSAKTPVTARESWDDSDLDDLLSPESEIPVAKPKGTKIQQLSKTIESQLQGRTKQKPPVGGFDMSGAKAQSDTRIKHIDSEDEDFSPISSLPESPKPAPRSTQPTSKVRMSTASNSTNTFGTSVWGSNQGKPGAGGKNETGDQESDWDDDISDL